MATRVPLAQLRQDDDRRARGHRERADRSPAGVLQDATTSRTTRCWSSPASSTKRKTLALVHKYFRPRFRGRRARCERIYTDEPTQDGERAVTLRRVGDVQLAAAVYHVPVGRPRGLRGDRHPRAGARRHAVGPAAQGAGRDEEGQQRLRLRLPVARADDCDVRRGGADRQLARRGTRRAAGDDRRADRDAAHEGGGRARARAAAEEHRAEAQPLGHDRPDA